MGSTIIESNPIYIMMQTMFQVEVLCPLVESDKWFTNLEVG